MKGAVFFDKDGTLLEDVPYNVDPARIAFKPGALDAMRAARERGFALFIVSNQPGVAMGRFNTNELDRYFARLAARLEGEGVGLTGWYVCPHPREPFTCSCRKPRPGMLLAAARDHGIDLMHSWMVGDILDDVEAGNRAGCRTILVDCGGETEWVTGSFRVPTLMLTSLAQLDGTLLNEGRRSA